MIQQVGDYLIWTAAVIAAMGTIFALFVKLSRLWDKHKKQQDFENYTLMWTLRLAIVNPEFPIEERIEAGKMYIEHGGNGYVKRYVQALEEELDKDAHSDAERTV